MTRHEIYELLKYLYTCDIKAFTEQYNFVRVSKEREYLMHYILKDLIQKVAMKFAKLSLNNDIEKASIRFTEAERRVCSLLFQRIDCSSVMLVVQEKIIKNLTKL